MKSKFWLIGAAIALLVALMAFVGCASGNPTTGTISMNSQQQGIWVNGTGEVTATPDLAILRLGIESQEDTVALAQEKSSLAMDGVMQALKDNGLEDKDIQTSYFNIQKMTRWVGEKGEEEVIGYRVTNMVTANIRDMENVGGIIDDVVVAGGDLTRIDGISFTVEDPTAFQAEARELAVADAEAKAEVLAKAAGVELGNPTYITESSYTPYPVYRDSYAVPEAISAGMPATAISPGEMDITINVQVAYDINA